MGRKRNTNHTKGTTFRVAAQHGTKRYLRSDRSPQTAPFPLKGANLANRDTVFDVYTN